MHFGIFPNLNRSSGGIYQYSLTVLGALRQWSGEGGDDAFTVFTDQLDDPYLASLTDSRWAVKPVRPPSLRRQAKGRLWRVIRGGPLGEAWKRLRRRSRGGSRGLDPYAARTQPDMGRWFRQCGVEVMFYPEQNPLSFETGVPYVMGILDLMHRVHPEFPEVSANGRWEGREYCFRNGVRRATLLVADSEVGKEDILNYYADCGATPDRVKVLPFLPASYLARDVPEGERQRVRAAYGLPERYLFYPAQFWAHKNHVRLVQALGVLKQDRGLQIPIALAGTHTGELRERTFGEVVAAARDLGVESQIHYLGYVPDEHMSGLYAAAVALAMPTFFGPTNIPIMEAWACGCPVLTSDLRGVREQAGDAAILAAPRSVESLAEGIGRLWTDESLRQTLVQRGRQRLAAYTPDDFGQRLVGILQEAKARVAAGDG